MARPFANNDQQRGPAAPDPFEPHVPEAAEPRYVAGAPAARIESLLDANATFEGHFNAEHDVRIQGTVSGEIACRGRLTIDSMANVRARITSHDVEIHGSLEGDITCTGQCRLGKTAVVIATIKAGSLVMEEGAALHGEIEANYSRDSADAMAAASAPLRARR